MVCSQRDAHLRFGTRSPFGHRRVIKISHVPAIGTSSHDSSGIYPTRRLYWSRARSTPRTRTIRSAGPVGWAGSVARYAHCAELRGAIGGATGYEGLLSIPAAAIRRTAVRVGRAIHELGVCEPHCARDGLHQLPVAECADERRSKSGETEHDCLIYKTSPAGPAFVGHWESLRCNAEQ